MRKILFLTVLKALFLIFIFLLIVQIVLYELKPSLKDHLKRVEPKETTKVVSQISLIEDSSEASELLKTILEYNTKQYILNEWNFGSLTNEDVVVVIQVHSRVEYLRYTIESHSKARGIERALLIFSHDYFDDEVNDLIESITFCKVIQIFFPYSIQVYFDKFPGNDPNDCPNRVSIEEALVMNCTNALFPDKFGHYREASIAQTKHHWWWKVIQVFTKLKATRKFDGLVVFLEEDHYVTEDYLYVAKKMQEVCRENLCHMLGLGNLRLMQFYETIEQVELTPRLTNMGLVFNRTTWNRIKECATVFCEYDDYNWDWSLVYISKYCLIPPVSSLFIKNTRVHHIGECGLHHNKDCDPTPIVEKLKIKSNNSKFFPEKLRLTTLKTFPAYRSNAFGGWGDKRDKKLCIEMAM